MSLQQLTHPLIKLLHLLVNAIQQLNEWLGKIAASFVLLLVALIIYDVTMRYIWNQGSIALQEAQWHLFALIILLGAADTLKRDGHVRIDILYQSTWMSERGQAWINLLGSLTLLIPFCLMVIYTSFPFIEQAYLFQETSPDPGGLPYRFLLKAAIPLGFILLMLQGIVQTISSLLYLLNSTQGG